MCELQKQVREFGKKLMFSGANFIIFKPSIPEGAFCVWTYVELEKLLVVGGNKKDFEVLVEYFNVRPEGNVATRNDPHGELKGRNVLTVVGSDPDQIKSDFNLTDEEFKR